MDEILVVDDESILIEMLQWQLQEHSFTVHTAGSGSEALAILHEKMIPIVISDIRMPGMDGIELMTRAKEIVPDVQCIFITGYDSKKQAVEATKLGGFSYLQKPLSIDELLVAIGKAQEKLELLRTISHLQTTSHDTKKLIIKQIRNIIFEIMNISVRYWELSCGKSKSDLAVESTIWTVSIDKGASCYRTRTLDRYLKISTIPKNPNYNNVLNTGTFVLQRCSQEYPELKKQLQTNMQMLVSRQLELELIK